MLVSVLFRINNEGSQTQTQKSTRGFATHKNQREDLHTAE